MRWWLPARHADANRGLAIAGNGTGAVLIGGTTTTLAGLQVAQTASAVNDVLVTNAATGGLPLVASGGAGADANIGLALNALGTGSVYFGGTTAANAAASVAHGTVNVNQLILTGTNTGTAPSIAAGGSGADANANLSLKGNGTGLALLGQTICTVSGATPQTCNGQRGIATTASLSTAAATATTYVINNTSVTASSLVHCESQGYSGTYVTNGYPVIMECKPGSGTITVGITNIHSANALSGTLALGFTVMN
jgi:hypothetical protein